MNRLIEAGLLEKFFSTKTFSREERETYALAMQMPDEEVRLLETHVLRRLEITSEDDLANIPVISETVPKQIGYRVLCLPTYRK